MKPLNYDKLWIEGEENISLSDVLKNKINRLKIEKKKKKKKKRPTFKYLDEDS